MLVEFSAKNFRSINEKQTISFLPVKAKSSGIEKGELPNNITSESIPLLKTIILFGKNASGKSNLLKAIRRLQILVIQSGSISPETKIPYDPFKLDKNKTNESTTFEIKFLIKETVFRYKIVFNQTQFLLEELYSNKAKLFVRHHGKTINFGPSLHGPKKAIEKLTGENQLFLSKAGTNNFEEFKEIYHFLTSINIRINISDEIHKSWDYYLDNLAKAIPQKTAEQFIINILKAADVGIESFGYKKREEKEFKFPEGMPEDIKETILSQNRLALKTIHKRFANGDEEDTTDFAIEEESDGTLMFLKTTIRTLISISTGSPLIIDELDINLHPKLVEVILDLFHSQNNKNGQLIFTTHNTLFLSKKYFRRDQIYFADKEENGSSEFYSLAAIEGIRPDAPYDKWYMSGKFGAVPLTSIEEITNNFIT